MGINYINYAYLKDIDNPTDKNNRLTQKQVERLWKYRDKGLSTEEISNKLNKPEELVDLYKDKDYDDLVVTDDLVNKIKSKEDLENEELYNNIKESNYLNKSVKDKLVENLIRKPESDRILSSYVDDIYITLKDNGGRGLRRIQKDLWNNKFIEASDKRDFYNTISDLISNGVEYIKLVVKVQKSYNRSPTHRQGNRRRQQSGNVNIEITVSNIISLDERDNEFLYDNIVIPLNEWLIHHGIMHLVNNGIGYTYDDINYVDTIDYGYLKPYKSNHNASAVMSITVNNGKASIHKTAIGYNINQQLNDYLRNKFNVW
jgi:hypothetical protein